MSVMFFGCRLLFASAGTSGAQFLKICVDAKAAALGQTGSVCSGSGSIFLNPSGIAYVEDKELGFSQISWIENINYSNISYAQKFNDSVFGLGINYLTVPSITKYDNQGNELSDSYAPLDMALNIAWAKHFYSLWNIEDISLGSSLKYISSTIDDYSATAYALDLGMQKRFADKNFQMGFAIQNLGTEIKFNKESDPLPLNFRLGGKYALAINSRPDENLSLTNGFNFLLDLNYMNDTGFFSGLGAEYARKMGEVDTAVRLGYNSNVKGLDSVSGFSAGFGIMYKKYSLDYAIAPYGDLGLTHRISLSAKF